ncbi:MAG: hypothetical protein Q8M95_02000 [Candidatus Methanoperedens sp.]|nr:hypothetical protein [Candidatus Methanoperedens sp.]
MSGNKIHKLDYQRLKEIARCQPITILVWGPTDPGVGAPPDEVKAYLKRLKIKTHLKKRFPSAGVFFSEDKEMQTLALPGQNQLETQAMQARIAHLVLMLDLTRGVHLELDHFIPKYPCFREKAYVLLPEQYVSTQGLTKNVLDMLESSHIIGFSDIEFDSCKLVTEKVDGVAHTIALKHVIESL